MSKFERVLSDDDVLTLAERSFSFDVEAHHKEIVRFAERLEQAVLQSPEIQEMKDALKQLVSDCERGIHVEFGGSPWLKEKLEELDYARVAIAKALGEEE